MPLEPAIGFAEGPVNEVGGGLILVIIPLGW